MRTICFTGRRAKFLAGYNADKYKIFHNQLVEILEDWYLHKGAVRFISGGAQGFDQLAFWAVNDLKKKYPDVQNIVYVPFKGQERRWSKYGLFSIDEYNKMIKAADNVLYLNNELNNFAEIAKALMDRNHEMVKASDNVIALYPSDDWNKDKGGTAECMRYAASKHVPIWQLKYHIDNNGNLTI